MEKTYENYKSFLDDCKSYNNLLFAGRKQRLPFIDSHTGIAQTNCLLWRSQKERKAQKEADRTASATLYSYPAQRWHKRRREYLMNSSWPAACQLGEATTSGAAATQQQQVDQADRVERRAGSPTFVYSLRSASQAAPQQPHSFQQAPPRADSTGSHSCVDSGDSRDQSSATSQSLDSPRGVSHLDDEHQHHFCNNLNSHFASSSSVAVAADYQSGQAEKCLLEAANLEGRVAEDEKDELAAAAAEAFSSQAQQQQRLRDQTRAAIRLHCRVSKSKNKNAGQSLMRTSSPLNGHNSKIKAQSLAREIGSQFARDLNANADRNLEDQVERRRQNEQLLPNGQLQTCGERRNGSQLPEAYQAASSLCGRPYVCSLCNQTYKTRPGLSYHFIHTHNSTLPKTLPILNGNGQISNLDKMLASNCAKKLKLAKESSPEECAAQTIVEAEKERPTRLLRANSKKCSKQDEEEEQVDKMIEDCEKKHQPPADELRPKQVERLPNGPDEDNQSGWRVGSQSQRVEEEEDSDTSASECNSDRGELVPNPNAAANCSSSPSELASSRTSASQVGGANLQQVKQNPFCDFCHGTAEKNRRTRLPEELISCASCGSSGHPSCLRFSGNILNSVKNYDWQCIDCKTCSTCNTADNEHQLLFCDDCDRSYHTYCLAPPLDEPPEGNWSCSSCLAEFRGVCVGD